MPSPADLVSTLLRARNPRVELTPETVLGADGLGLDSIAIVEVLLEIEELFGITLAAAMLAEPTITAGDLIERVQVLASS